ncbi:MAG: hypothetical protein A3G80_11010 [Betaproteobacteria bacterium RIFCSPLOWO2_12_FULL_62_13b]|nr:MAG: hypothetical protein A3G80_11010 [Betaproteobacteria bacterium RIFCSPLOWO2_12_FULL_62_13b]
MRRLLALLPIGLLVACATTKPIEPIPQQGTVQRSVTWVMTDDPSRACDEALGKPLIGTRNACARLRGNDCTIYVRPPKHEDDRNAIFLLGHEALHCFAGRYHYAVN